MVAGRGRRWLAPAVIIVIAAGGGCQSGPSTTTNAPAAGYPVHTGIVATTFWIGEVFDPDRPDGSQVCSTYDTDWAFHYTGVNTGSVPAEALACAGSIRGGCDGVTHDSGQTCETERRTAANNYFPTGFAPRENPFYLDLPYDDVNDPIAFANRCHDIPWANDAGYAGRCTDRSFSYLKNRWVRITGATGRVCYGQVEDAGPAHDGLYHDARYVFGTADTRPAQAEFNNAGMDVSPALNGCLGFAELNGQNDRVTWQFVTDADVPAGPWKRVVTASGVHVRDG